MSTTTDPFIELEFVEALTEGGSFTVLGIVAEFLAHASVELNNEGILLPESEWRGR